MLLLLYDMWAKFHVVYNFMCYISNIPSPIKSTNIILFKYIVCPKPCVCVCIWNCNSRRWTHPRLWITPGTSGSMTALWTTHPPKLSPACTPRRPLPSPHSKEKRTLVWLGHVSSSRDNSVARCGLSRYLHMEAPLCDPSPLDSVPPPANLSAIVGSPCLDSPHYSIVPQFNRLWMIPSMPLPCPLCPASTSSKPRCPSLSPPPFSPLLSLSCICVSGTLQAPIPNCPYCFSHSILILIFLCRSFIGGSPLTWWPALLDFFIG